jgi:hypothetical protein
VTAPGFGAAAIADNLFDSKPQLLRLFHIRHA